MYSRREPTKDDEEHARQVDLTFMAWLKTARLDDLHSKARALDASSRRDIEWMRVACARAIRFFDQRHAPKKEPPMEKPRAAARTIPMFEVARTPSPEPLRTVVGQGGSVALIDVGTPARRSLRPCRGPQSASPGQVQLTIALPGDQMVMPGADPNATPNRIVRSQG